MKVKYNPSVLVQAGFRSITMTVEVEKISEKRAKVLKVLEIDGESVQANMSRTGANRQKYYGIGAANREIGKIKNLSTCDIVD